MDMDFESTKSRKLVLSNNIDSGSVYEIIQQIIDINSEDDQKTVKYNNYMCEPIRLYINSFGGSVYDGLALVDVIKQSRTPVITIAIGSAMSTAFWIFLAGHIRLVGENATIMYHEISTGIYDKLEGLTLNVKETQRLQKMYDKEITSRTKITQDQLDDYRKRKAEWFISAKEAIKLGVADQYYGEAIKFVQE